MGSLGNHTLSITCSMGPREVLPEVGFFGFSCLDCFVAMASVQTLTVESFSNLRLKLCEYIHYTHTHAHAHAHTCIPRTRTHMHNTHMDFPGSSAGKESACNTGDPVRSPGWEDPLEKGTPVFLPRESQGQGSLVCCHLWGHTESDTTEVT